MRTIAIVTLVCALSLAPAAAAERIVAVSSSNDPVKTISTDALPTAEKAALAADTDWARAYQSCDMKLMDKVLHPDIMYIHAHARVDNKQILMKQFATCANEQTTVEPMRVIVINPETAIIEAAMKIRQKGLADPVQSLYTRVYVRQGGDWRMIAHQTTRDPGVDASGKPLPNPAFQPRSAAPAAPSGAAR